MRYINVSPPKKIEVNPKLRFVQIDEFYPISPQQHNSFHYYVNEYYIKGKAQLAESPQNPIRTLAHDRFVERSIQTPNKKHLRRPKGGALCRWDSPKNNFIIYPELPRPLNKYPWDNGHFLLEKGHFLHLLWRLNFFECSHHGTLTIDKP